MQADLWAISPLDGRYKSKIKPLEKYGSEAALIHYRCYVELAWLKRLLSIDEIRKIANPSADDLKQIDQLLAAAQSKDLDAAKVKEIEATTNHDVKAVEYFLQNVISSKNLHCFIHFACTSEDINNLSYALMLKEIRDERLLGQMNQVVAQLTEIAKSTADLPMLSRTHGQTASPTTLGKEVAVFASRLSRQTKQFEDVCLQGKINGAVGNYNAHYSAFPTIDWQGVAKAFIEQDLGLEWNPLTTQIENHDSVAEYFHALQRYQGVLLDASRDFWSYISLGYFKMKTKEGEIGSSTMPHKVNPIDFENAEGNLGLAISLSTHLCQKLPISRLQRDLSDSTVLRSIGSVAGYSELALHSFQKGLGKLQANPHALAADLENAWEVLAEPIQTVMRRFGISDAYERLKSATRGRAVSKESLHLLIDQCPELPKEWQNQLKTLTPSQYTGIAGQLVQHLNID